MQPSTGNRITPPRFDEPIGQTPPPSAAPQESLDGSLYTQTIQNIGETLGGLITGPWAAFFAFSLILSLVLAVGSIYCMIRILQFRRAQEEYYKNQPLSSVARRVLGVDSPTSLVANTHDARWRDVIRHANTDNPNDWRHAIMEADIMLEEAITARGYEGDSLGEKMKQISRAEVNTIDAAWDAHKVRNRVAHEGSGKELNQREVRQTIDRFEAVLKELGYLSE